MEGCCEEDFMIQEEIEFVAQAPEPRHDKIGTRVTDSPPVRADEPTPRPDPTQLYSELARSGQVASKRYGRLDYRKEERETLVAAYVSSLDVGTELDSTNFRDALVDAMAEYLDNYGLDCFPWNTLHDAMTGSHNNRLGMLQLLAFYTILTPWWAASAGEWNKDPEGRFQAACQKQRAGIESDREKGKTTREIWEDYMKSGGCEFHEHEGGVCWRMGVPKPRL